MVNYEELPLFPLQVVLYPDMPLPLHVFEPRYREMILKCVEEKAVFGIVLSDANEASESLAMSNAVGTTARITQYEILGDGRINIEVVGETRFRVTQTKSGSVYPSAKVEPFWEQSADPLSLQSSFDQACQLFRAYLRSLLANSNRSLSSVQLPREPECLSYAIASVLQISLTEKQRLLEITNTERRLIREIEILIEEIASAERFDSLQGSVIEETAPGISELLVKDFIGLISRN